MLERARAGDQAALEELYRSHRDVAAVLAAKLVDDGPDVDDVVADAFVQVFAQLRAGAGPRTSFRPYLLVAVRNAAIDLARRSARIELMADAVEEPPVGPIDDADAAGAESDLLARALRTLPERWQLVLWWTAVEGRSMREVAELLRLNANAAAALAFRAREGLRLAYLGLHLEAGERGCASGRARLPALARERLSPRDQESVRAHLSSCPSCAEQWRSLRLVALDMRVG